jgi:hypothetical protein
VRQQAGLRQDQGGHDQAKANGEDEVAPGGTGVTEQPRIDWSHNPPQAE